MCFGILASFFISNFAYASEPSPTPIETPEVTVLVSLTEEEKILLIDSIQVIRAVLVFALACFVFYVVIKFLEWFF